MSLPIMTASMTDDHICSKCGHREVEPDQVGEPWRVCPKCQKDPDAMEHDLAKKLGMVAEGSFKRKVDKPRKNITVEYWKWTLVSMVGVLVVGALAAIDWSGVDFSDEVWNDVIDLAVFAITLSVIVGVMGYIMGKFRRF